MRNDCPWQRVIFLSVFSLLIDLLKGSPVCRNFAFVGGFQPLHKFARCVFLTKRFHANKTFTVWRANGSGLVGGDANTIFMRESRFLSPVCRRACAYAIATAEANAKMFRIVACPTAGSCGIVPAVLAAVAEEENSTLNDVTRALFTAGAIGRITAENASISGAVGGCQAECGTAAAMAAAAAVDLLHGTTEEMGNAMALAMKNILGLACDPVAGLVEVPCVKRNGFHAVHALVAVEMAMMGIRSVIPPDDVIDAMGRIGRLMPVSLRETSLAGLAMTEEGKHISERLMKQNAMPAE